jgi:hypothetical protein
MSSYYNLLASKKRSQSAIDPDAQAFITAAGITDSTQQSAIITLVSDLKTYGIWTKFKAIYPIVGGTASSHKFNLKDPRDLDAAFRLTFSSGWTHSANGMTPNGTTSYADTFLIPNTSMVVNSAHLSYYSRTDSAILNEVPMGVSLNLGGNGVNLVIRRNSNVNSFRATSGIFSGVVDSTSTDSRGLTTGSITSSSSRKIYKNGTLLNTNSSTITQVRSTGKIFIGAVNITDLGGATLFTNKECAFASIGDGLTDTESANLYTAVQAFQTTLGRQVGVPIVSDADAQAFLNAAVIEDITQANAINNLVIGLKADGLWTKMKAIYPIVGGTASQHKFNLKDPRDLDVAFRLTFSSGWTHSANGMLPNGTSAFADTFFTPSSNLLVNNTSMSIYVNNNIAAILASPSFGCYLNSTATFYTTLKTTNIFYSFIGSENGSATFGNSFSNTDTSGFYITSRTSSTNLKSYKNNLLKNTTILANTGTLPNLKYTYGAFRNSTGIAGVTYNNYSHAFMSLGEGLTDTDAANLYTAVQAYQTTLSRNV